MAVQRFNLLSGEEQLKEDLREKIKSGEINADNFSTFDAETQEKIKELLFEFSTESIDANEGASTLEFILMAFMRISMKKMNGISLNSEDVKVEKELEKILAMHQITNGTAMKDWLFDYMSYAQYKTMQFLHNREEHIDRKKKVTGKA